MIQYPFEMTIAYMDFLKDWGSIPSVLFQKQCAMHKLVFFWLVLSSVLKLQITLCLVYNVSSTHLGEKYHASCVLDIQECHMHGYLVMLSQILGSHLFIH